MPELEEWKLTPGEVRTFLLASRASYNSFVLYHNFRHAIDVLQSVFFFLLQIGVLPPYAMDPGDVPTVRSPIASMLTPLDALTLLIASIGHDVGHPGVNNIFLVKLNAPLAQLYNDNSVLEAFHCAAFSQILRRHWPAAFKDRQVRKLLISSILATDMGVHHKFMESLGSLQEKYHENDDVQTWKPQDIENYRTLLCGLLIKCADISNVVSSLSISWSVTKLANKTVPGPTVASCRKMDKHSSRGIREPRRDGEGGRDGNGPIWRSPRAGKYSQARHRTDRLYVHICLAPLRGCRGSHVTNVICIAANSD